MNHLTALQIVMICLGVLFLVLFIIYARGTLKSKGSIVVTNVFNSDEIEKGHAVNGNNNPNSKKTKSLETKPLYTQANFCYYLPEASLVIKATATVTVFKSADDNSIVSSYLSQLQLDTKVKIETDTDQLLLLNHKPFAFANDEIKWSVNENGLLENVSVISEDRIGNIVAQLGQTPTEAGKMQLMALRKDDLINDLTETKVKEKQIIETRVYTNEFVILPSELEKSFSRSWHISVDGLSQPQSNEYVNASFTLEFDKEIKKKTLTKDTTIEGLLTRPLIKRKMSLKLESNNENKPESLLQYEIIIPDISTLIAVPIQRTPFIKQTTNPKFSSGLLVENYINLPSTFEALISIPINVAKAFVSIPSALFNFKISHIRRDTELLNAQMELVKAQQAAKKTIHEAATQNVKPLSKSDLKKTLQQWLGSQPSPLVQAAPTIVPQLGKAPATDTEIASFTTRLQMKTIAFKEVRAQLDPTPATFSWLSTLKTWKWNDYENLKKPYCVPVAAAHLITCWSANTSIPRVPRQEDVIAAYSTLIKDYSNDGTKGGCSIRKMLLYWEDETVAGDRLNLYSQANTKDLDSLRKAVYYYGGCIIGLQMPKAVCDIQKTTVWDPPKDCDFTGDWAVNSWDGHAVIVVGVDNDFFEVVSWDRVIRMSSRFYTAYNDEAYVLLSSEWFKVDQSSPAGAKYTQIFLESQIDKF